MISSIFARHKPYNDYLEFDSKLICLKDAKLLANHFSTTNSLLYFTKQDELPIIILTLTLFSKQNFMRQLSGQDAMFLFLESEKNPMHIGGLYIFDSPGKPLDVDSFRAFFEKRLHLSHIFRQRLIEMPFDMGNPFWVDDPNFNLDSHFDVKTLDNPGGRKELVKAAAEAYEKPMDRTRPLWKATFIKGLQMEGLSEDAFALLVQVHHAAIDGKSGVEIMASLFSMTEEPFSPPPPKEPWNPKKLPNVAGLLTESYGKRFKKPKKFLDLIKDTAAKQKHFKKEIREGLMKPPPLPMAAPKTFMNVPVSGKKIFGAIDIPLKEIKFIKNAVDGATVNDVILSVCAGGLRKYMIKHGRLPIRNLIGLAPVSVRKEDEVGSAGNRISAMLFDMATNEVDPIKRLESLRKNTRASKTYSQALPADQIMEFVPSEVAAMAGRLYLKMGLSKIHSPFFNLIMTNVPGPPIPLYMNRYKLQRLYGLGAVMDGLGVFIIIFSYAGKISLSVTADTNALKDMDLFTDSLRIAYNDLKEAVEATMTVK